jgi:hypothetical protein
MLTTATASVLGVGAGRSGSGPGWRPFCCWEDPANRSLGIQCPVRVIQHPPSSSALVAYANTGHLFRSLVLANLNVPKPARVFWVHS